MTLQQAVFAGLVDPGNIVSVREILTSTTPDTDTAVFSAAAATYTITPNADGSITVDSNGGADGIDTVRNVEQLQFSDATLSVAVPATPSITSLVAGNGSVTVNFTGAASATSFTVRAFLGTDTTVLPVRTVTVAGSPAVVTGLTNGSLFTFTVTATSLFGTSAAASGTATPVAPVTVPGAPSSGPPPGAQRLGDRPLDGTGEQRRVGHHRVLGPRGQRGRRPGRRAASGRRPERPAWSSPG